MSAPEQLWRTTSRGKRLPLCGRQTQRPWGDRRCHHVVPSPGDGCSLHDPEGHRARLKAELAKLLGAAR